MKVQKERKKNELMLTSYFIFTHIHMQLKQEKESGKCAKKTKKKKTLNLN